MLEVATIGLAAIADTAVGVVTDDTRGAVPLVMSRGEPAVALLPTFPSNNRWGTEARRRPAALVIDGRGCSDDCGCEGADIDKRTAPAPLISAMDSDGR